TSALADLTAATNLEIDLASGERRHRGYQMRDTWTSLTGCEDVLVVNNNAAATLLTLQALCQGREVIISRGQLIEIGGAFRLPEIFELSGAKLHEIGTTNRTTVDDYRRAINENTAAIMHVHPSNYRVVGFSQTPEIAELVAVAREHDLLAIDDIGSGSLVDITNFGLPAEPTFCESIAAGADLVLGSGDKLLGGPQAGVILGQATWVERLRRHPLARAIRVGKLTLTALAATLAAYQRGHAQQEIPVLAMLSASPTELLRRADQIVDQLGHLPQLTVSVRPDTSPVGGGSVPAAELPTAVICLDHHELSSETLARRLRLGQIRLYTRIQNEQVLVDLRSVATTDDSKVQLALRLIGQDPHESDAQFR
ncbi:MAG: L-seryl-tRNA(Sec) selenium transferase, partial [Planctomycetaceae bacterium]